MRAPVDLRQRADEVGLGDVADQQNVEEPVVRLGLGGEHHPAAQVAAVRDDDFVHASLSDLVVDGDPDLGVAPAGKDGQCRPQVRDLAAERFRRLVRALRDRAAHPDAGRVDEPALRGLARPGAVADASGVDLPRGAADGDLDRGVELARDPVRADEVDAGAARNHRELDAADPDDPGCDLVHRPVAADGDHERGAVLGSAARQFAQVLGPLGEQGVALEPVRRELPCELRPAAAGRPAGRRGVDQEDGPANGRR